MSLFLSPQISCLFSAVSFSSLSYVFSGNTCPPTLCLKLVILSFSSTPLWTTDSKGRLCPQLSAWAFSYLSVMSKHSTASTPLHGDLSVPFLCWTLTLTLLLTCHPGRLHLLCWSGRAGSGREGTSQGSHYSSPLHLHPVLSHHGHLLGSCSTPFFLLLKHFFIYLWLPWVFLAVCGVL